MIKVIPKDGINVKDPNTLNNIPTTGKLINGVLEKGKPVGISSYWKARFKDGDVTFESTFKKTTKKER